MSIEEGKKAPAFTLPDENGNKLQLKSLAGQWVVLYFYQRDDTPGADLTRAKAIKSSSVNTNSKSGCYPIRRTR